MAADGVLGSISGQHTVSRAGALLASIDSLLTTAGRSHRDRPADWKEDEMARSFTKGFAFLIALAPAIGLLLAGTPNAYAQGCVASRVNAPNGAMDPEGEGYFLAKGQWQASLGYRYFHSHRHFVGSIEQDGGPEAERDRRNTAVENRVHLPELSLSYGLSDRLSLSAALPILLAQRKIPGTIFSESRCIEGAPDQITHGDGIGDLNLVGRYWVAKPSPHNTQNLEIGLGIKLPTGQDDVTDSVTTIAATGADPQTTIRTVDQSIQPGDGGFGLIAELQAFKVFGSVTAFATGEYLANPRETNGVPTGRSRVTEAIMSVSDQYGARVGVGMAAPFHHALGLSLAARLEGVPVRDVLGGSAGFRRPGYSLGIEPGISYTWQRYSFSLSVPYLVRRVRPQSVSDEIESDARGEHVQGDAAFADYIIVMGFSRRF